MHRRALPRGPVAAATACTLILTAFACSPPGGEIAAPATPAPTTGEVALATWKSFHVPDPERIPSPLATNPGTPWGDYTGSKACGGCHAEEYRRWRGSFHSRTLYDAMPETVFGDFSGKTSFADPRHPFTVEPFTETDPQSGKIRFMVRIHLRTPEEGGPTYPKDADTYGSGLPEFDQLDGTFEVIYAFGNRRHRPTWPAGQTASTG